MNRKMIHTEGESGQSPARRSWQEASLGKASKDLLLRDSEAFLHQSISTPCLGTIRRAEGIWIEDLEGRRYMDFHGNSVHHVGYGHPAVISAIRNQLEELSFAPRRFTNETAVRLAEKLIERSPWDEGKVLFTTGGSDAIEVALKIARAATGRFKTLSFWDSFHGAGFGAASVGGESTFRSHIAGPLLPGTEHVAPFACYRCPYGHREPETCGLACAEMIRYVLDREGDVAAFIAEPMRAIPYVPPRGFWKSVRQACDEFGVLLVFDEIPTGLGKTGRFLACEHDQVDPDILVLGKALGGGVLPIAAVISREDLDVAGDFAIGHYTHEKNPVTASAAVATLDIIDSEGLVERARVLGDHAMGRLREFAAGTGRPIVGDVRGRGLHFGVEIVEGTGSRAPDPGRAERILYSCLDAGLSFKISQGNVLTLSPPLVIGRDDLDRALSIVEAAILEEDLDR